MMAIAGKPSQGSLHRSSLDEWLQVAEDDRLRRASSGKHRQRKLGSVGCGTSRAAAAVYVTGAAFLLHEPSTGCSSTGLQSQREHCCSTMSKLHQPGCLNPSRVNHSDTAR